MEATNRRPHHLLCPTRTPDSLPTPLLTSIAAEAQEGEIVMSMRGTWAPRLPSEDRRISEDRLARVEIARRRSKRRRPSSFSYAQERGICSIHSYSGLSLPSVVQSLHIGCQRLVPTSYSPFCRAFTGDAITVVDAIPWLLSLTTYLIDQPSLSAQSASLNRSVGLCVPCRPEESPEKGGSNVKCDGL